MSTYHQFPNQLIRSLHSLRDFLTGCLHLLYWTFFKPSAIHAYLREAIDEADGGQNPLYRRRILISIAQVLVISFGTLIVALICTGRFGLSDWREAAQFIVIASIIFGVAAGVLGENIAAFLATSIAWSIAFGIMWIAEKIITSGWGLITGLSWSIALGITAGVSWGVSAGITSGAFAGIAIAVVGVVGTAARGDILAFLLNVARGLTVGIVWSLGGLRVPFYVVETFHTWFTYPFARREADPIVLLRKSPVTWDEFLALPQLYLDQLLLEAMYKNPPQALAEMGRVVSNPFQRWAPQRALRTWLEKEPNTLYLVMATILSWPTPYHSVGVSSGERKRAADKYFTAKLLLAELAGVPPIDDISDTVARVLSAPWRKRGRSPLASLAQAYYDLLSGEPLSQDMLNIFAAFRDRPGGEEVYHTFNAAYQSLACESSRDIAGTQISFAPLGSLTSPLRPSTLQVFYQLQDAITDVVSYLSAAHPQTRRDNLLRVQGVLVEVEAAITDLPQPEARLVAEIVDKWRVILIKEGARLARGEEVVTIPNPYVAGRPLRPEDGRLFVGRQEKFRNIQEALGSGVAVMLYGQRRVGKSSILLHLHKHLPRDLCPVYIDMQRFKAEGMAGLFHTITGQIASTLATNGIHVPTVPRLEDFAQEPFLALDGFLRRVEEAVGPQRRVVLLVDEFEEIEALVNQGRLDPRIFGYLRGLSQTGRGFALIFAGLHTLEQMNRDYWNPFFASARPIKVTYLSRSDAWQLITDPVEGFPLRYDGEAIERIIAVTCGQPYLVQQVCFELVAYLNGQGRQHATVADVNAVLNRAIDGGEYYFADYVWGRSRAEERVALSLVAEASGTSEGNLTDFATIEERLGQEAALAAVNSLRQRDVFEERVEDGRLFYRFQVELSRMWVARNKPLARVLMEERYDLQW
jgi:AAA+ ATPase superfamily predicted ATPase